MSKDDQQKRDGFIPLGDVAGAVELPGGRALTPAAPQARHHFTTLQQVNQLVEASEAEPDLGFMARLLALCSLPRTNPRARQEYVRRNGPHVLILSAGGWPKRLPFGNLPRLLLAWVCSEAVRTQRRDLVLGRSLYEFMRKLGLEDRSGGRHGERARLKNQMRRLFSCSLQLVYADGDHEVLVSSFVTERAEFWWTMKRPEAPVLWDSTIRLGEEFFNEIIAHPIPLDMNILRSLKRSPLGLDLYFWLVYRTFTLKAPLTLSWKQLYRQFAADEIRARDVVEGLAKAVLIEDYPDYPRGPCCLVLQRDGAGQPIHVVWGIPAGQDSPAVVVTAYRPDPTRWDETWRRRQT